MDEQTTRSPTCQEDGDLDAARTGADARVWRPPAHVVRFCVLRSCQPDGGEELARLLEARLGVAVDRRVYDGSISLEALECIGLCDIPQAVTIDDEPIIGRDAVLRAADALLAEP